MSASHTQQEQEAVREYEEDYQNKIHFYISDEEIKGSKQAEQQQKQQPQKKTSEERKQQKIDGKPGIKTLVLQTTPVVGLKRVAKPVNEKTKNDPPESRTAASQEGRSTDDVDSSGRSNEKIQSPSSSDTRGRPTTPSSLKGLSPGEERGRRRASSYDPRVQTDVRSHPKRACSLSEAAPEIAAKPQVPVTELIDEFLAKQPPKSPGPTKFVMSTRIPLPQLHTARKEHNLGTLKGGLTVGLDHLDNLCRLMHQLALLREENSKLRKRVNYLEDTKAMLKMKNEVLDAKVKKWEYLEDAWKRSSLQKNQSDSALNSTTPEKDLDDDVFGGKGGIMKLYSIHGRHQRSQSVGSVEMPEVQHDLGRVDTTSGWGYGKYAEKFFKKSIRLTRWPRETVKKVFGAKGKKLDDHQSLQPERPASPVKKKTANTNVTDLKRPGSGSLSRKQIETRQKKVSSSSVEPSSPSPSSCQSEPAGFLHDEDDDLTTEIWMGPPGKQDAASPSSPLTEGALWFEQKYFGKDLKTSLASVTSATSTITTSTTTTSSTRNGSVEPFFDDMDTDDKSSTLKREESPPPGVLVRRKSSPSLTGWEDTEIKSTPSPPRSRSTSARRKREASPDVHIGDKGIGMYHKGRTQTAWGKVKDYIHTRKDSLKRRGTKSKTNEEYRKSMNESILAEAAAEYALATSPSASGGPQVSDSAPDLYQAATCRSPERPSRKSEVHAPPSDGLIRKPVPSPSASPSMRVTGSPAAGAAMSKSVDLQSLLDNVSDEFSKKMQQWEHRKSSKTSSSKDRNSPDVFEFSSGDINEDKSKSPTHTASSSSSTTPLRHHRSTESWTPKDTGTPRGGAAAPIIVEEMQRKLTDSFSRKMQEWEKIKGRPDTSPTEKKDDNKLGLKKESWRNKSDKKTAADREQQKMEKELVKVEREQQKLEEKRQRLERETQRTIKREEELERKREHLEVMVFDGANSASKVNLKFVNVGEYEIQGISEEFAKKLHEWDVLQGQKKEHPSSTSDSKKAIQCSDLSAMTRGDAVRVSRKAPEVILPPTFKEGQLPLPRVVKGHTAKPLLLSTITTESEDSIDSVEPTPQVMRVDPIVHRHHRGGSVRRRGHVTEETQTTPSLAELGQKFDFDTVEGLQAMNSALKSHVTQQEQAYRGLRDNLDRQGHTMHIMNQNYIKEISALKRQLASSNRLETYLGQTNSVGDTVTELWNRVQQLEKMLRKEQRLGEMPLRRVPPYKGRESSRAPPADFSFNENDIPPRLVEYISKLHGQVGDLQQGVLERNKMITDMKKHLAIQEAMQVLLKVDIQRREFETSLYRRTRKLRCRRHYTVAGHEFATREFVEKENLKEAIKVPEQEKLASNFEQQFKQLPHGKVDQPSNPPTDASEVIDIIKTCCAETEPVFQDASDQFHSCSSSPVNSSPVRSGATSPKPSIYGCDYTRPPDISVRARQPRSRQDTQNSDSSRGSSVYQDPNRVGYTPERTRIRHYSGSKSDSTPSPQIRHETSRLGDKYMHTVSIPRATSPMNRTLANHSVKVELRSPAESHDEGTDKESVDGYSAPSRSRAHRRTRAEARAQRHQQQPGTSFHEIPSTSQSPSPQPQHHTWQPTRPWQQYLTEQQPPGSQHRSPSPYGEPPQYYSTRPAREPNIQGVSSSQPYHISPQVTYHQPPPVQTKTQDPEKSFMLRSASYFSPKPYNPQMTGDGQSQPQSRHSTSSLSTPPGTTIQIQRASPVQELQGWEANIPVQRFSSYPGQRVYSQHDLPPPPGGATIYVRKPSDQENNNFWQEIRSTSAPLSQAPQPGAPYVQTAMRKLSSIEPEYSNGTKTIITSDGKVKRLTEAFGDRVSPERDRPPSSPMLRRRNSREIPKEGTVQRRLEELVVQAAAPSPVMLPRVPEHRRTSHEVPSEGTVQKRLEELRQYYLEQDESEGGIRYGSSQLARRISESSESTVHGSPVSTSSQSSPELQAARRPPPASVQVARQTSQTSHPQTPTEAPKSPKFLRPRRSTKSSTQQKRLSPFEMLVRDTLSLNLETSKIGESAVVTEDVDTRTRSFPETHQGARPRGHPEPPMDTSSTGDQGERKRSRGRFLGFFKASK